MIDKNCQSYQGRGICRDGFPERPSCRDGVGSLPHCLNPDFFTKHLHAEDGSMVLAEHRRRS